MFERVCSAIWRRRSAARVTALCLPALLAACVAPQLPRVESALLHPDGGFTLYVTNQSYALEQVDIRVKIDGELVVADDFDVGTQHTFVPFPLALTRGAHTIHAWSETGEVALTREFKLEEEDVGIVMFWYNPDSAARPNRFIDFSVREGPLIVY